MTTRWPFADQLGPQLLDAADQRALLVESRAVFRPRTFHLHGVRSAVLIPALALMGCTGQEPAREVAAPDRVVERTALTGGRVLVLADHHPPRLLVDDSGRWSDATPDDLPVDAALHDVATDDGRAWALVGDCAMGRASLWTSDDEARSWDERDLPMGAHCSAGSYLRLLEVTGDRATLDVSWGAVQQVFRFRTTDAGRTWSSLGCRYERPGGTSPCDG